MVASVFDRSLFDSVVLLAMNGEPARHLPVIGALVLVGDPNPCFGDARTADLLVGVGAFSLPQALSDGVVAVVDILMVRYYY